MVNLDTRKKDASKLQNACDLSASQWGSIPRSPAKIINKSSNSIVHGVLTLL